MDITQLRAFLAVAKHGSFTRAADELHLSQPTVSGQIKALEVDLGVSLFGRGPNGVTLSKSGAALLPRAEKVLSEVRELIAHSKALRGDVSGKIRVGTLISATFLKLGSLLSEMRVSHPNLEIETQHGLSGWIMDSVRSGHLDFGFFLGTITHPDVIGIPLTTVTYRIVAPTAWATQMDSASWGEIAAMPWVWPAESSAMQKIALKMFVKHGMEMPKNFSKADREATIVDLVSSGVGLALIRESLALDLVEEKRVVVWQKETTQATLWLIHLTRRQDDPVILAATRTLQKLWG